MGLPACVRLTVVCSVLIGHPFIACLKSGGGLGLQRVLRRSLKLSFRA